MPFLNSFLRFYRSLPLFKGKLTIGRRLFKNLIHQNKSVQVVCHKNIKYKIPHTQEVIGIELLINGIYEKAVLKFLKKNLHDGDVFFDVGANIGSIGLPATKQKKNIKYYGFEASPFVFNYLKTNFALNKVKNYQLLNNLVSATDKKDVKFYESFMDYGKSSSAPTYSKTHMLVDAISIDSFCKKNNIGSIDFIKIDVQGFEINVFEGMKELLLNKKIKNLLFEFEAWAEDEAGFKVGSAQEFIKSYGYDLYAMDGKKFEKTKDLGNEMFWAKPRVGKVATNVNLNFW